MNNIREFYISNAYNKVISFLCMPIRQSEHSPNYQHVYVHFLPLKSFQLQPNFLVLSLPTFPCGQFSKSLMIITHPPEKTKYSATEDIHPPGYTNPLLNYICIWLLNCVSWTIIRWMDVFSGGINYLFIMIWKKGLQLEAF